MNYDELFKYVHRGCGYFFCKHLTFISAMIDENNFKIFLMKCCYSMDPRERIMMFQNGISNELYEERYQLLRKYRAYDNRAKRKIIDALLSKKLPKDLVSIILQYFKHPIKKLPEYIEPYKIFYIIK